MRPRANGGCTREAESYRGESGGVLSPAMAREMISPQVRLHPPADYPAWGLGVGVVGGREDLVRFFHDGQDEGFVASIAMWPNLGRGLVIMMNGVDRQLMGEINNAFMEQYIASVRR